MRRLLSVRGSQRSANDIVPALLNSVVFYHHHTRQNVSSPRTTIGPLFDSHCHIGLGFSYGPDKENPTPASSHWPFKSQQGQFECEEQFIRSVDSGVTKMTLIGVDASSSERVELISRHLNSILQPQSGLSIVSSSEAQHSSANVDTEHRAHREETAPQLHAYWTAGIHPHSAHLLKQELPVIDELVRRAMKDQELNKMSLSRLVAIGETGMDFYKSRGSYDEQKASLIRHLELAQEFDLPVIIHSREADNKLYDILRQFSPKVTGVMHCFSSDIAWMHKYLDLGYFISFTNNITYSRTKAIQEACAACPLDRIVIETDSPFLPPQRARGQTNEPSNTRDTFEQACKLRGIWGNEADMKALQSALWNNTHSLFKLPV